jgi:hypothetical protein
VSRRAGLAVGLLVAGIAVGVLASWILRAGSTAVTPAHVTVECIGVDGQACAAWADSVLADGPGIHTFDPEALESVRLSRSILGLFGDCQAEYFLGRYDEAAGRETVPCPDD